MPRLTNKAALITGGTTGIGFAAAKAFLEQGARVAITGQNRDRLQAAARELGGDVVAILANQASLTDIDAAAAQVKAAFGQLDILFVNAGIAKPMPLTEITQAHVSEQLDVNFTGALFTIQRMLPLLKNPSSVILTSTALAEQGMAGMSVYSASKAALRSLARTLSAELLPQGIRVNVVTPGPIDTPIYGKTGLAPDALQAMAAQVVGKVPMGRFGTAAEIARAVLFLAADDSSYMAGQELVIDGGMAAI